MIMSLEGSCHTVEPVASASVTYNVDTSIVYPAQQAFCCQAYEKKIRWTIFEYCTVLCVCIILDKRRGFLQILLLFYRIELDEILRIIL